MDFKKKLKIRLYTAIIYLILGVMIIVGAFAAKPNNDFISSFGLMLAVIGIARIRNYFIITKSEESIKKQQIAETDERNILIMHKARSATFFIYILISAIAVIILSFLNMYNIAKCISYSISLLIAIYWISYWIYRKKS